MSESKHSYKLVYFPARGAAEIIRLVFKQAGVDFIDERIARDTWPNIKQDQPLKVLPVLEIDGKKVCQSQALARYVAKEFGLMGSNILEELRINELQETMVDLMKEIYNLRRENDETKQLELAQTIANETIKRFLDFFEMRLKENNEGSGFFVGDQVTLADLILYNGLFNIKRVLGKWGIDPLESKPILQEHFNRIEGQPRIAEWIKSRPDTEN